MPSSCRVMPLSACHKYLFPKLCVLRENVIFLRHQIVVHGNRFLGILRFAAGVPSVLSPPCCCRRLPKTAPSGRQAAAPAIGWQYSFYSSSSVLFLLVIVVFLRHFSRLCFIFTVCQSRSGSSRRPSDRRVCTSRSGCTRYGWAPSSRPHPFCRLWHIFRRRRTYFCPPSSGRGTPG